MRLILTLSLFFIMLDLVAQPPKLEWAGDFNGPSSDVATNVVVDDFGNVYVCGYFKQEVDFDPGPGPFMIDAGDSSNTFLVKFDSQDNFLWALSLGENNLCLGRSVSVDGNGFIYLTGDFRGSLDLDPGTGTYTVNSLDNVDTYLLKLSPDGNFVWAKTLEGMGVNGPGECRIRGDKFFLTGYFKNSVDLDPSGSITQLTTTENGHYSSYLAAYDTSGQYLWNYSFTGVLDDNFFGGFDFDQSGNIYMIGSFSELVDFDAGPGFFYINSSQTNIFYVKLDLNGNFVWAKKFDGDSYCSPEDLVCDTSGYFYSSGIYLGTVDLSVTSTPNEHTSAGSYDTYISKMDAFGNIVWIETIGGSGTDKYQRLDLDIVQSVYAYGVFEGNIDMDPGAGTQSSTPTGNQDLFVQRLTQDGDLIWNSCLGSSSNEEAYGLDVMNSGNLYFTGKYFNTVDFDPDTTTYNLTATGFANPFVAKWGQDSCALSSLVISSASNITCLTGTGTAYASVSNAVGPVNFSWNTVPPINDQTLIVTQGGIYTVTSTDSVGCVHQKSVLLSGPLSVSQPDLGISLIATEFSPGFHTDIWVESYNDGCIPTFGQVYLILDPDQTFVSSVPAPLTVTGDTIIWNYSTVDWDSPHFQATVDIVNSPSMTLNSIVSLKSMVTPETGDADTTNNEVIYSDPVIGSYDPNDKHVSPIGECAVGFVPMDQLLTYIVRFQNTGNAPAINIQVVDSLPASLNINSLRVIAQSHDNLITEIDSQTVIFRFDNIMLPDSIANEPESHGYVVFEVEPVLSVAAGEEAENKVEIYFDFNSPVVTNYVLNTFTNGIPEYVTNLNAYSCSAFILNDSVYNSTGIYTQYLQSSLGCDSTVIINLQVFDQGGIQFLNDTLFSQPALSYQWFDCVSNAILVGQTAAYFIPDSIGSYSVIWSSVDCSDTTDCYVINQLNLGADNTRPNMSVYPVPAIDYLKLSFDRVVSGKILVSDLLGQILIERDFSGSETDIDISLLPSGSYFVHVVQENHFNVAPFIKN
jgi:uncharacterized repeat protein (TIGR01451 family)